MYHSPFREDPNASIKVEYPRNLWIDFGMSEGGTLIDMMHSVFGLGKIFVEYIVMRHLLLVAIGVLRVRTVNQGGILLRQDVGVDTGFGLSDK